MGWTQIVVIVLLSMRVVVNLLKNGEATRHSFGSSLIGVFIWVTLLRAGGFFG